MKPDVRVGGVPCLSSILEEDDGVEFSKYLFPPPRTNFFYDSAVDLCAHHLSLSLSLAPLFTLSLFFLLAQSPAWHHQALLVKRD